MRFRGIAAVAVVYVHCACLVAVDHVMLNLLGHAPVIFFFLLSGYVLTKSLETQAQLTPRIILQFYVKRFFRLYPAVFASLIIALILVQFLHSPQEMEGVIIPFGGIIDKAMTVRTASKFIDELTLTKMKLIPPLWTIKAEFLGSAMLPIVLILLRKLPWLAMPLVLLFTTFLARGDLIRFPRIDIFAPQYFILPFLLGCLVYLYNPKQHMMTPSASKWCLFYGALLIVFTVNKEMFNVNTVDAFESLILAGVLYVLVPCNIPRLKHALESPFLQFFGGISYGIYLIHIPILHFVWSCVAKYSPEIIYSKNTISTTIFLFALTLILSVPLSILIFKYIEKPFNSIGYKIASLIKIS